MSTLARLRAALDDAEASEVGLDLASPLALAVAFDLASRGRILADVCTSA